MRFLVVVVAALLACGPASAQMGGSCIIGTAAGTCAAGNDVRFSGVAGNPPGSNGQVIANIGGNFAAFTLGGDGAVNVGTGALAISKIGGVGISLGGAFSTVGAYTVALTATAATALTLPTTGTLATTANVAAEATRAGAAEALLAPLASPTFTGSPVVPGYLTTAAAASTYAPLASPALTGVPTVPTAAGGTNTTQAASTAFVTGAVAAEATRAGAAEALLAPRASPTFTGTVTTPAAVISGEIVLGTGLFGYAGDTTHVCLGGQLYPALASAPTLTLVGGATVSVLNGGTTATATGPAISAQTTTTHGFVVCVSGFSGLTTGTLAVGNTDFVKVQ